MRAAALLLGVVADAAFGDPRRYHPVAGYGVAAAALERRLWRPSRRAGLGYAVVLVAGPAAAAALLERRLGRSPGRRLLVTAGAAWSVIGGRSLAQEATRLGRLLEAGNLEEARRAAPALMGRDPTRLDASELCRGAIESVAENTADAAVGPLLWGAVLGLPGLIAYRASNTLDAMVGHRNERYQEFGWASARLDDVLTFVPARLAALLTAACATGVGGSTGSSWRILRRDGRSHPSPNAGQLEAAFAGALDLQLGGASCYDGLIEQRPTLGDGRVASPPDIQRAVRLSRAVIALAAVVCATLAFQIER